MIETNTEQTRDKSEAKEVFRALATVFKNQTLLTSQQIQNELKHIDKNFLK
jgi:hypothetical protein